MDFITKLPKTTGGLDTIWDIVDRLTKSAHFLPIKETDKMVKLTRTYIRKWYGCMVYLFPLSPIEIVGSLQDFGNPYNIP